MRKIIGLILVFINITWIVGCQKIEKPGIAFSFDDGNTKDISIYRGEEWNAMIRKQLKDNQIQAVWFVMGESADSDKGKQLLQQWNNDGHIIANHTYSHFNYNDSLMTCKAYAKDIQKCDSLLIHYNNYRKIVRFPFLKGGNTISKRDSLIEFLQQNDYKQGWVTIDASDWYVNMRLIQRLKQNPNADISAFKDFYVNHIFDRAQYYNNLSSEINHRQIKHTVLLHFNLTSALFLSDLIEKFKKEGWVINNYSETIQDPIYSELPSAMPYEQSLIWVMAKQIGKYDLRYPGEDGDYEKDKMDKLGL